MTNQIVRMGSITPVGLVDAIMPAVWYPFHEDSASVASTAADALGSGPSLTLTGALATGWSANAGMFTFSGTNYWLSPTANAYLAALCRLDNISGQQLLIGYELQGSGANSNSETLIAWGRQSAAAGASGGWMIGHGTTEAATFAITTPSGSAALAQTFASQPRSTTDHYVCVLEIIGRSATAVDMVHSWVNLTAQTQAQSALTIEDLLNGGTAPPNSDANARLIIGAREQTIGAFDRIAASASSAAKMNNVWIARNSTVSGTLAIDCLADMAGARREFPAALRGR